MRHFRRRTGQRLEIYLNNPLQYAEGTRHRRQGGEGDCLPLLKRKHKMGEASVKNLFARIDLTDKLLRRAKDNRMAFVDDSPSSWPTSPSMQTDMIRRFFCNTHDGFMGT
jgi:hypothetical protein